MSDFYSSLSSSGLLLSKNEIIAGTIFDFKLLFWFIVIIILLASLTNSLQLLLGEGYMTSTSNACKCTANCKCKGKCKPCKCNMNLETFSNDKFFSYKDTFYPNYSSYQTAALTPLGQSLIFGKANRFIVANFSGNKPIKFILDISCNLYLLNGNPFGMRSVESKPVEQKYLVYLLNKDRNVKKLVGELKTNSSEEYKLRLISNNPEEYLIYNQVNIVYSEMGKESVILTGRFTIA